ncbi:MAG TPA: aminopeptidase P family protein, partial [Planctomycetaceae bacterium]|nr:aminopeptidase P family protein [Planctomycetaceae bacterium]
MKTQQPKSPYARRRRRAVKLAAEFGCEAFLVTSPVNVRYLTGFTGGDSFLMLAGNDACLLSDPRYEVQIEEECPGLDVHLRRPDQVLLPVAVEYGGERGYRDIAFEASHLSYAAYQRLVQEPGSVNWKAASGLVERLRVRKEPDEIAAIRQAVEIAERVFTAIRAQLTPKWTENEIANELERLIRNLGGSGCSFDPIVAVGPRAALPHAPPRTTQIGSAPLLLIDWGATFAGYRSDLTRVILTSKIPPKIVKAYEAVLAAQQAAIQAIRPGVPVSEIDAAARSEITKAKLGKFFNHGLGHGIGLEIHEDPFLRDSGGRQPKRSAPRPRAASNRVVAEDRETLLSPGMVVTIEPGVYLRDVGGIRIEDD